MRKRQRGGTQQLEGRAEKRAAPSNSGSFAVEKVLEAKADARGTLLEAKVAWAPTWEKAKNLSEITKQEAYNLLFS